MKSLFEPAMGPRGFSVAISLMVLPLSLLAGCGGSGHGISSNSALSENETGGTLKTFGSLTTRVVGTTQSPVVSTSTNAAVTGIAGASFTSLIQNRATVKSLNNTRIAFLDKDAEGILQIFTLPSGGGTATQITFGDSDKYSPVFSSDGSTIAFNSLDSTGVYQIFTVPSSGGTPTQLTSGSTSKGSPAYSPDGLKIAYSDRDSDPASIGYNQIFTIPITGGTPTQITTGNSPKYTPVFSPDGSRIAYGDLDSSQYRQIFTIPAAGGTPTQITFGNTNKFDLSYSPDGSKIAYDTVSTNNIFQIFTVPTSGGKPTQITFGNTDNSDPAFSPDGSRIAYSGLDNNGKFQIFTLSTDGGTQAQLTTGRAYVSNPSWSPYLIAPPVTLIGKAGVLSTSAAGFLFGQKGDDVLSVLTFDTGANTLPSRSTGQVANVTSTESLSPNLLFSITATDRLSSLRYVNYDANSTPSKTVIVPLAGGTTSALASFNSATGKVATVLPYSANRGVSKPEVEKSGSTVIIHGRFSGVYKGDGTNAAPHGTNVVRLNATTGELVSTE